MKYLSENMCMCKHVLCVHGTHVCVHTPRVFVGVSCACMYIPAFVHDVCLYVYTYIHRYMCMHVYMSGVCECMCICVFKHI